MGKIFLNKNELMSMMYANRNDAQVEGLLRFFKTGKGGYGEGDLFLGIKVPVTREVTKSVWNRTSFDDLEECIASKYHEVRLAALLALVQIFRHAKKDVVLQKKCIDFYLSHLDYVNNWDLVDLSCYELLGAWLLDKDRSVLYDFAKNGKTIWEKRIGIVSTMKFVRHEQFDDTLAIAEILLDHPHDLIHKAVGWLLREVGKHNRPLLTGFLKAHKAQMPRTALRYAIEHYPEQERKNWLER